MRVFRRIMLGSGIDIESLPDTQKLYYKATAKVFPTSASLGSPILKNSWDSTNGEGVIVCAKDISKIGANAFKSNTSLTSITIPDSVTSIGVQAFYGCSGRLTINSRIIETDYTSNNSPSKNWLQNSKFTELILGDNIKKIGKYAFTYCTSLTSVTVGNGVTSIGAAAFDTCTSLTSITIPDSVVEIGINAFWDCTSLTSIVIPDSVTEIGYGVFYYCTSMQYYDFSTHESVPKLRGVDAFRKIPSTCKIIVPDALYDEWIAATNWSEYASYIIKKSDWDASQTTE